MRNRETGGRVRAGSGDPRTARGVRRPTHSACREAHVQSGSIRSAICRGSIGLPECYNTSMINRNPSIADPETISNQWLMEFEAASRRSLEIRFRYAFISTYKPVLDDEPYRSFESMAEYRDWCEQNLPDWLGYGRV